MTTSAANTDRPAPAAVFAGARPGAVELPFPVRTSPHAGTAREHHQQWMKDMGLVTTEEERARLARWDLGSMAGVLFPDAEPETLDLLADVNGYWLMYDDQFETGAGPQPALVAAIVDMTLDVVYAEPGHNPYPGVPFCAALSDLMQRIAATGVSPAWLARLRYALRDMLSGFLRQHVDHAQGAALGVEDLLGRRRADIGMQHEYELPALVRGWELPESVAVTDTFTRMYNALHEAMAMLNDVYTAYRDRPIFARAYNTLLVLEDSGMSEERALEAVRSRIRQRIDDYLALKRTVPELLHLLSLSPEDREYTQRYLTDVETVFAGADMLHRFSGRYDPTCRYSEVEPTHVADWGFAQHARQRRAE